MKGTAEDSQYETEAPNPVIFKKNCPTNAEDDQRWMKGRLTFPVRLLWTKDPQDIDAATSMGGLQNHVWIDTDFFADAAGRVSSDVL